uniref:Alanine--glyoxylate transaminase n=1 Tax=Mucochytrium quahogii TaxID=96639 RepID=A0A7S2RUD5_9STRA|mmetsp:Transcript_18185/g.29545  ORF Transcript_18185/g.29545 Transcript_18185/m.29545 type:complete len:396 (+) Transcript_18185:284-1471(+)
MSQKAKMNNRPDDIVDEKNACPFLQGGRGDLLEYSVIYTDRAVNLMSAPFKECMKDMSSILKSVYHAQHCAIIPGSGSYAMEAVARQFGTGKNCMVIRNGFFSFRWSDIFQVCKIPSKETVLMARVQDDSNKPPMAPVPAAEVVEAIKSSKPDVVFAPHVETATGILLPDDYIKAVADAVHEVGGIFVLDAIAAGALWANMQDLGVDVLITAPQKGWSGPASCGIVMMNDKAKQLTEESQSTSFCCNLRKWLDVMQAYEKGGFMYYTTLPTDALMALYKVMKETRDGVGFEGARKAAISLGTAVRKSMAEHGLKSAAAPGFESPTVVVSYTDSPDMVKKFIAEGIQIAGGVPFKCNEPAGLQTFRIGLFGVDKMNHPDQVAATFAAKLGKIMSTA